MQAHWAAKQCDQLEERNDLESHVFLSHKQTIAMKWYLLVISILPLPPPNKRAWRHTFVPLTSASVFLWASRTHWWSCEISGNTGISFFPTWREKSRDTQNRISGTHSKDPEPCLLQYTCIWLAKPGRRVEWEPNELLDWGQTVDVFSSKNWGHPVVTQGPNQPQKLLLGGKQLLAH